MNTAKLIKLSPLLIMVIFLAYSGYSIHAGADDPDASPSGLAKELDGVVHDILAVGDAIKDGASVALRDPFQVTPKTVGQAGESEDDEEGPLDPDSDPLAEIVQRLSLDATFLQGGDQMAIIDGKLYSKGQHLLIDGDAGNSTSKLYLVNVLTTKVILHAGGKNYVLGYSDRLGSREDRTRAAGAESSQDAMAEIDPGGQLAMFQKLLNSPLGALGKSMIGDRAGPSARSKSARSKRARRPRTTAQSAGNP